ncbi:MAG: RsmD family RNA methyltransferase, partial [Bacilli bacterium]
YDVLRMLNRNGVKFDLIFIDPPYCKEMIPEAMKIIEENDMLQEDGLIVTKIDSIEEIYSGYKGIELSKSKKYGNTTVCFYKYLGGK